MGSIFTDEFLQYLTLACVFVGVFMLITGMSRFLGRGENQAEAHNRRLRMIRDGVPPQEAIDRIRRTLQRNRGGQIGPALPLGDRPLVDRRLRDRLSGGG